MEGRVFVAGFPLTQQVNNLWRWDTLEDVRENVWQY
jgi:hypothetical protein